MSTTPTPSILIVEPDPSRRRELAHSLEADRFHPLVAHTIHDAGPILREHLPSAALISLMYGQSGGLRLLDAIRDADASKPWDPQMPILTVAESVDRHEAVRAIERGAHDHLALPLHYPEVAVRLRSLIRRARGESVKPAIEVGPLVVDRDAHRATLLGRAVALSAKEFALLAALAKAPRRVFSKQELMRDVWHYSGSIRSRTVDSHASRVRRKLAAISDSYRWVENVWGVGYRLLPDEV